MGTWQVIRSVRFLFKIPSCRHRHPYIYALSRIRLKLNLLQYSTLKRRLRVAVKREFLVLFFLHYIADWFVSDNRLIISYPLSVLHYCLSIQKQWEWLASCTSLIPAVDTRFFPTWKNNNNMCAWFILFYKEAALHANHFLTVSPLRVTTQG